MTSLLLGKSVRVGFVDQDVNACLQLLETAKMSFK